MQIDNPALLKHVEQPPNITEHVSLICAVAKSQEEGGDFEAARGTLSEFWGRVGERPQVESLEDVAQAELLLRAGTLSGWIGSAKQLPGAQEAAKDLISESATIFERLGLPEKVAEARIDLAICYLREGAYDESRVTLQTVLDQLANSDSEQRLRALLNKAIVEKRLNRYDEALTVHSAAAPLFEKSKNHALRGKFHNEFATVLKNIGHAEQREEYLDRALIEYSAASFHFDQAGHKPFLGRVENNRGSIFARMGDFREAHDHFDRARALFVALKDKGSIAQVDDSSARAFLEEGRPREAELAARGAVQALREGDESSLLAEALTTHSTALARLGDAAKAKVELKQAVEIAQRTGDLYTAGLAALTIVEELRSHHPNEELCDYYRSAEECLRNSQHLGIRNRLGECARALLLDQKPSAAGDNVVTQVPEINYSQTTEAIASGHSLEELVLKYEAELIRQALEASGGSVTRAARMLGITHQGLAFIINGRHKDLLSSRTPVKPRRRSIMRRR